MCVCVCVCVCVSLSDNSCSVDLISQPSHYYRKQFLTAVLRACATTFQSRLSTAGGPLPSLTVICRLQTRVLVSNSCCVLHAPGRGRGTTSDGSRTTSRPRVTPRPRTTPRPRVTPRPRTTPAPRGRYCNVRFDAVAQGKPKLPVLFNVLETKTF